MHTPIIILSFAIDGLFKPTIQVLIDHGYKDLHVVTLSNQSKSLLSNKYSKHFSSSIVSSLTILPSNSSDDIIIDKLLSLSQHVKSEALFPIRIQDVTFVAKYHKQLVAIHPILIPNYILLNKVSKKQHFTKLAETLGFLVPKTIMLSPNLDVDNVISHLDLPIISKPIIGEAGIGINAIQNRNDLLTLIQKSSIDDKIILQQQVSGEDVAMTLLANKGSVFGVILRKRWFTPSKSRKFSPIRNMEYFHNDWLEEIGRKFVNDTNFSGIADFDLKVDFNQRKAYFLECDPRMMGSLRAMRLFGINLPGLLVDQVRGLLPIGLCVKPKLGYFLHLKDIPYWIASNSWIKPRRGPIRIDWKLNWKYLTSVYYRIITII